MAAGAGAYPGNPTGCDALAFGVPKAEFENAHIHDVTTFEWAAWIPILALIVALGIFPNIVFHVTDGAVTHLTSAIANVIK